MNQQNDMRSAPESSARSPRDLRSVRVLLVSDSPAGLPEFAAWLEQSSDLEFESVSASCCSQACHLLSHETFHVVVLDMALAGELEREEARGVVSRLGEAALLLVTSIHELPTFRRELGRPPEVSLRREDLSAEQFVNGVVGADRLKQSLAQREALSLELRSVQHYASLGQLTAGIAHEIKTPLQIIAFGQKALAQQLGASEVVVQRNLERVHAATERALAFIEDLLDFGNGIRLHMVEVQMANLVQLAVDSHIPDCNALAVQLEQQTLGDLRGIPGDPQRLTQLMNTLIDSAVRATGSPGTVTVHSSRLDADTVVIEVWDMGDGFDPAEKDLHFEPFHSANRSGRGGGLELAICKSIVEAHGGSISAMNNPMGGAIVRVVLPAHSPVLPAHSPEVDGREPAPPTSGQR